MTDDRSDDVAAGLAPVPDAVMREVPKGAAAVAGLAVAILLVAWLAVYLFVFLPRGPVG
jgi:hypothetical protein